MIQFIQNNADMIVNLGVIISSIGSILLWSHRKLRVDMNVINARLDATNTRIDHAYSLILDMMKEMKSTSNKQP
jgi:flagellar capping protein FliD